MDVNALVQIVRDEELDAPALYGHGILRRDAVVLERGDSLWKVYLVDERHAVIASTLRTFASESEALERVLIKLRQVKEAKQAEQRMAETRHDGA